MKWRKVDKINCNQPTKGTYRDWKEEVRAHCYEQCVYCCISDGRFGGMRNFHVEHYKPKKLFKNLENDMRNLFYACSICNIFKGDDWPGDPADDHSVAAYPDPSKVDYCDIFEIDDKKYVLSGRYTASKYVVERLFLNREQLILERRRAKLLSQVEGMEAFARALQLRLRKTGLTDQKALKCVDELLRAMIEIGPLGRKILLESPYEEYQVRRT